MSQFYQGTAGRFGMLKQTGLDVPQTTDGNFHYIAFTGCDFAPTQGVNMLPPEAGNTKALPRGTFKTGVIAAGGIDFIPRLENRFGYWMEAAFGDASTSTDQTIAQYIAGAGTTADVNAHLFGFVAGDEFDIPYVTVHKWYPHDDAEDQLGEIVQDVRVQQFILNAVSADVIRARLDMMGRVKGDPAWDIEPGWSTPTLDTDDSFAVTACSGSVSLNITDGTPATSTSFNVTNARLTVTNNLTPITQSRVIGSPHPADYPVLSRSIVFETVVLITDYDLYIQTFGGPANPVVDTDWSCSIAQGDFDVTLRSGALIGATAEYYTIRYRTLDGNVDWSARPIVMMPNQPIVLALQGVVTPVSDSGTLPFYFYIQNDHANYS